ncbi:MAG TPA: potassium channel family protein, partial [Kineosporiaceae bacterium]|nr:potassium channel family protein [Kineosporiaceae bacterium]
MTKSPWLQLLRWLTLVTVITVVVVVVGGTLVWLVERNATGSNLHRWGDSLWWSVTTLTTVGYGEHVPVTIGGRLIAVAIMFSGIGIIGAVAAVVGFAFAGRLAQRLEAAVSQVETQVEQVEAEMESVSERIGARRSLRRIPRSGLRELVIGVSDPDTAASLTWLLARLGWHPEAGDAGVAWRDGGVLLRIAVRPWDTPFGVQGRLTFGAGSPERLLRISTEATQHG